MASFSSTRFPARLPLIVFALGALHCGDDALILTAPPAPVNEAPSEPPVEAPVPGVEVPGAAGESDGSSSSPGTDGAASDPDGSEGPAGEPPANETPPSGTATEGACQPRGVGGPFWLTEGEAIEVTIECAT